MNNIRKLGDSLIRLIAAGEVVEDPRSVVKELIENAIDAGAKNISVEIKNGGQDHIRVSDDGEGMSPGDIVLCTKRHTTSKIFNSSDLGNIKTLGFRGEFLASLAAVARVQITSKYINSNQAYRLQIGPIINDTDQDITSHNLETVSRSTGTSTEVFNLFSQVPARRKFLKNPKSDTSKVTELIHSYRLACPTVKFILKHNGNLIFNSEGMFDNQTLHKNRFNAIVQVLGSETAKNLIEVNSEDFFDNRNKDLWNITGWIGKPSEVRPTRQHQYFILNGRLIKSKILSDSLEQSYGTFLARKQFPIAVLYFSGSPSHIDVNVHPAKLEVRFKDEPNIQNHVIKIIESTLLRQGLTVPVEVTVPSEDSIDLIIDKKLVQKTLISADSFGTRPIDTIHIEKQNDFPVTDQISDEPIDPLSDIYDEPLSLTKGGGLKMTHVVNKSVLNNLHPIVQLRNLYIVAENPEDLSKLYFIDQHAVAERIALENLLKIETDYTKGSKSKKEIKRQKLLVPLSVNLSPQNMDTFLEIKSLLLKFGYRAKEFDQKTVLIQSLPLFFGRNRLLRHTSGKDSLIQDFRSLIDSVSKGLVSTHSPLEIEVAKLIACKNSIKAGDYLDHDEMENLLKKVASADFPFVCCHGRPGIFEIQSSELDKMFWR
jgi:DNA mismatch repair protein MutL